MHPPCFRRFPGAPPKRHFFLTLNRCAEPMPPDADVTAVSNATLRLYAQMHARAAKLLNDLARYRETGNTFGVGYVLRELEALALQQERGAVGAEVRA